MVDGIVIVCYTYECKMKRRNMVMINVLFELMGVITVVGSLWEIVNVKKLWFKDHGTAEEKASVVVFAKQDMWLSLVSLCFIVWMSFRDWHMCVLFVAAVVLAFVLLKWFKKKYILYAAYIVLINLVLNGYIVYYFITKGYFKFI